MSIQQSRAGVPSLWNLMPYDLRWGLCNNNNSRNKVHTNVKCLNHLEGTTPHLKPWSMEKLSSMKLDLDAK